LIGVVEDGEFSILTAVVLHCEQSIQILDTRLSMRLFCVEQNADATGVRNSENAMEAGYSIVPFILVSRG
jgi:hypothetical protein